MLGMILAQAAEAVMSLGLDKMGACLGAAIAAIAAGIGIGKIVKIKEEELNYTKQSIEDTEAEKKRLSDAIEVFIEKTQKMVESMKVTAGEQEA